MLIPQLQLKMTYLDKKTAWMSHFTICFPRWPTHVYLLCVGKPTVKTQPPQIWSALKLEPEIHEVHFAQNTENVGIGITCRVDFLAE